MSDSKKLIDFLIENKLISENGNIKRLDMSVPGKIRDLGLTEELRVLNNIGLDKYLFLLNEKEYKQLEKNPKIGPFCDSFANLAEIKIQDIEEVGSFNDNSKYLLDNICGEYGYEPSIKMNYPDKLEFEVNELENNSSSENYNNPYEYPVPYDELHNYIDQIAKVTAMHRLGFEDAIKTKNGHRKEKYLSDSKKILDQLYKEEYEDIKMQVYLSAAVEDIYIKEVKNKYKNTPRLEMPSADETAIEARHKINKLTDKDVAPAIRDISEKLSNNLEHKIKVRPNKLTVANAVALRRERINLINKVKICRNPKKLEEQLNILDNFCENKLGKLWKPVKMTAKVCSGIGLSFGAAFVGTYGLAAYSGYRTYIAVKNLRKEYKKQKHEGLTNKNIYSWLSSKDGYKETMNVFGSSFYALGGRFLGLASKSPKMISSLSKAAKAVNASIKNSKNKNKIRNIALVAGALGVAATFVVLKYTGNDDEADKILDVVDKSAEDISNSADNLEILANNTESIPLTSVDTLKNNLEIARTSLKSVDGKFMNLLGDSTKFVTDTLSTLDDKLFKGVLGDTLSSAKEHIFNTEVTNQASFDDKELDLMSDKVNEISSKFIGEELRDNLEIKFDNGELNNFIGEYSKDEFFYKSSMIKAYSPVADSRFGDVLINMSEGKSISNDDVIYLNEMLNNVDEKGFLFADYNEAFRNNPNSQKIFDDILNNPHKFSTNGDLSRKEIFERFSELKIHEPDKFLAYVENYKDGCPEGLLEANYDIETPVVEKNSLSDVLLDETRQDSNKNLVSLVDKPVDEVSEEITDNTLLDSLEKRIPEDVKNSNLNNEFIKQDVHSKNIIHDNSFSDDMSEIDIPNDSIGKLEKTKIFSEILGLEHNPNVDALDLIKNNGGQVIADGKGFMVCKLQDGNFHAYLNPQFLSHDDIETYDDILQDNTLEDGSIDEQAVKKEFFQGKINDPEIFSKPEVEENYDLDDSTPENTLIDEKPKKDGLFKKIGNFFKSKPKGGEVKIPKIEVDSSGEIIKPVSSFDSGEANLEIPKIEYENEEPMLVDDPYKFDIYSDDYSEKVYNRLSDRIKDLPDGVKPEIIEGEMNFSNMPDDARNKYLTEYFTRLKEANISNGDYGSEKLRNKFYDDILKIHTDKVTQSSNDNLKFTLNRLQSSR